MSPDHRRKTILFVLPSLQPGGGANGVTAWMLEALRDDHQISLLLWEPPDFEAINRFYGTALSARDLRVELCRSAWRSVLDVAPRRFGLLKDYVLLAGARRRRSAFDLIVSANYESDLGGRSIQRVTFPRSYYFRADARRHFRWYQWYARQGYYRLAALATGFSFRRMRENVTLVNSDWTGRKFRALHGGDTTTLYPPAFGDFPDIPWDGRENGFLVIGRISPEKRLELVIDIIAGVRAACGRDIHLHIVGTPDHRAYYAMLARRAREHASWLFLEEDMSRAALVRLAAGHRYGIHGMADEHFGVAVAEMVRAGCIVFCPRDGGQVEVVGYDQRLLYERREDAVEKIARVINEPMLQRELLRHLAARREYFSTQRFVGDVRAIVARF